MDLPSKKAKQNTQKTEATGTLAIDLGNTTTIVAFQAEHNLQPRLLNLSPISSSLGQVPSLIWSSLEEHPKILAGQEVLDHKLAEQTSPNLKRDFKRFIGKSETKTDHLGLLTPENAGELLISKIWARIPKDLNIKRLVLAAPIQTYRSYRKWLHEVFSKFDIEEIALVDEPTAAAMGADVPPGSKLLVLDIGGSTIDLSLVALEGGEGKAAPIAQLMRFNGKDLEGRSSQALRCAKVLGKAGIALGGRDIDRWIAKYLLPDQEQSEELLNTAESLKCKLSQTVNPYEILEEHLVSSQNKQRITLSLSRKELEKLLIKRGFIKILTELLKQTLSGGRRNNCTLKDLYGVVAVGGGVQIPLVKSWLSEQTSPAAMISPPPIEAVALGALKLTPGVNIKDVLHKGISIRCWDNRTKSHIWHPLFVSGQTWPTNSPLEIILSASQNNQSELEIKLGEPSQGERYEVLFINDMPTLQSNLSKEITASWETQEQVIKLNPPGQSGEDCLKLEFRINSNSMLEVKGVDLRTGASINTIQLGQIR